jgi:hypothetical protein
VAWFYESDCEGDNLALPPGTYSFGAGEGDVSIMQVSCVIVEQAGCTVVLYTAGGDNMTVEYDSYGPVEPPFNDQVATAVILCRPGDRTTSPYK